MAKKHNTKVPDFSSHKQQRMRPKGVEAEASHAPPPPPPPVVPKAHAVKTSGHRGA